MAHSESPSKKVLRKDWHLVQYGSAPKKLILYCSGPDLAQIWIMLAKRVVVRELGSPRRLGEGKTRDGRRGKGRWGHATRRLRPHGCQWT